ncbi:mucin, partial [Reticulomyxa filosa]
IKINGIKMPFGFFKKKRKADDSKENEPGEQQPKETGPSASKGAPEGTNPSKASGKKSNKEDKSHPNGHGSKNKETNASMTNEGTTTTKGRFVVTRSSTSGTHHNGNSSSHTSNPNASTATTATTATATTTTTAPTSTTTNGGGTTSSSGKRVLIEVEAAKTDLKGAGQYTKEDLLTYDLPFLRQIQDTDKKKQVLIRKLRLCCVIFTFDAEEQ